MLDFLAGYHPVVQALMATSYTWGMNALGAAAVFTVKGINRKLLGTMLGFAGGVMIAASYWALLEPAIEMSGGKGYPRWLPAAAGFIIGAAVLRVVDALLPHLHAGLSTDRAEGLSSSWRSSTLLLLAMTLHNIPEGLAVGVLFGSAAAGVPGATLGAAVALTLGMGIQNFPEGFAVSMPLRAEGMSRFKSFWYGQLSGLVEPAGGVVGALTVVFARSLMPYALGFAAGAMIFVVIEEVIPESQQGGNADYATLGAIAGFILMMILDVTFH